MIQFLLNGQEHTVEGINPNTTLLTYLREQAQLKGTKEGCASGDCGACTLLIGEWQNDQWQYTSINSCLALVASLHGKQVLTVEALANDHQLHPVQQAMVDCHGSQCGFCTPGVVMSLAGLYLSSNAGDDHAIETALSGNLCRCTGYKPILSAAKQAMAERASSKHSVQQQVDYWQPELGGAVSLQHDKATAFVPSTEKQLADLLFAHPEATLIAGGTDINLQLTQQFTPFNTIIHTRHIKEWQHITETENSLRIGAAVSYQAAAEAICQIVPAAEQVLSRIGSLQIRNAATLAGNIANASPIGDGPPLLMAMQATVVIGSATGHRDVAIDDFITGYKQTCMQQGEFISAIVIPKPSKHAQFAFHKLSKRFEDDISTVLLAARFEIEDNKLRNSCIAFGGMAATPVRAHTTEQALLGTATEALDIEALVADFAGSLSPISDVRASADYRQAAAQALLRKSLFAAKGHASVSVWEATA